MNAIIDGKEIQRIMRRSKITIDGFRVLYSASDVERFAAKRPACDLKETSGWFQFDSYGGFMDDDRDQPDGDALTEFRAECRLYGCQEILGPNRPQIDI